MASRVLLVEPDVSALRVLEPAVGRQAATVALTSFPAARARLLSEPFDLLVTNLRLHAYNGLHLVHLARSAGTLPRSIVYTARREPFFAKEVQHAGAFYESYERLPYALTGYLQGNLPPADRRDGSVAERRQTFRGGRRCSDLPVVAQRLGISISGLDTV